jgi:hypothetical protein
LVPLQYQTKRQPGGFAFHIDSTFFEPLPPEELEAWER